LSTFNPKQVRIQAGGNTQSSEIHNLINYIWNMGKLTQHWQESIIVPIYKKKDKTACGKNRGTSLLPTTYKMLSNILVSITPYVDEII